MFPVPFRYSLGSFMFSFRSLRVWRGIVGVVSRVGGGLGLSVRVCGGVVEVDGIIGR